MKKRLRNKIIKRTSISMDLQSIPKDMDIDEWYHYYDKFKMMLWDSSLGGHKPNLFPKSSVKVVKIKDVKK